jgi:hypothetical protein
MDKIAQPAMRHRSAVQNWITSNVDGQVICPAKTYYNRYCYRFRNKGLKYLHRMLVILWIHHPCTGTEFAAVMQLHCQSVPATRSKIWTFQWVAPRGFETNDHVRRFLINTSITRLSTVIPENVGTGSGEKPVASAVSHILHQPILTLM